MDILGRDSNLSSAVQFKTNLNRKKTENRSNKKYNNLVNMWNNMN